MKNYEQSVDLPARGDGSVPWANQHIRAAQLRARGQDWHSVADELKYAHSTVQNYSQLEGWSGLVDHYRAELWSQEVADFFHAGSLEALGALRQQWRLGLQEIGEIEERLEGPLDDKARANLERALYSKSKATTMAADKFLGNIGFAAYRKRQGELDAEKQTTGAYGQTVRHEGGEQPIKTETNVDPIAHAIAVADALREAAMMQRLIELTTPRDE